MPDLFSPFDLGPPPNEPDRDTFYQGEEHGYLDYPTLDEVALEPVR